MISSIKNKIILMMIVLVASLFAASTSNASGDVTKKLYQDITINKDGSITVREAALLDGDYNGREREIEFKNYYATTFTGAYSNFTGNTDIYDGTAIKDIKIYDISQKNFSAIEDILKIEKTYKEVESAKKGKYGVYTISKNSRGADFRIYCPSKKKKVFGMEYTITDAVVVHNDIAELYWNVLGDDYREDIEDFQVLVHLPGEDNDLRVWTHGPLTGANKIIDAKTVYFKDTDVSDYTAETIRIMFNKQLVSEATKKSNVNGKENILKYEQSMADEANAEREKKRLEELNKTEQYVLDLEENQRLYYYNRALKLILKLEDETEKNNYIKRIEKYKDVVNKEWKEDIENDIEFMKDDNYRFVSKYRIEDLKEDIQEGFDEQAKEEYLKEVSIFENILEQKNAKTRKNCMSFVITVYIIFSVIVVLKIIKILSEKYKYNGRYYRDFPSNDNPYILEYLMKKRITNLSFSTTILDLIAKKVIKFEKIQNVKKEDIKFVLANETYIGTKTEAVVLEILFDLVGTNNECTLDELKKYGKKESNAIKLSKRIEKFKKSSKEEAKKKEYFKFDLVSLFEKIAIGVFTIIALFMAIGVFYGLDNVGKEIAIYLLSVIAIGIIYFIILNKDKNRSEIGKQEYSKWLAHKRYLKDFSKFDEKDLPEITLWEKYLVTATILGCADKVQDKLKMYINNVEDIDSSLLLATSLNYNLVRTINKSVNSSISTANMTVSSTSSSGGGYGGGSSFGGGRRRPEAAVEVVSKIEKRSRDF